MTREWQTEGAMSVNAHPARSTGAPEGPALLARLRSRLLDQVLGLLESLRANGLTLVIVTHDERVATTANRLISMRDGAFVDETHLTGGSSGHLGAFADWERLS